MKVVGGLARKAKNINGSRKKEFLESTRCGFEYGQNSLYT